jgi:hypothetical protein
MVSKIRREINILKNHRKAKSWRGMFLSDTAFV